ncbi:MAG TPA: redox-regulated ATPase YchF [Spirochaetota bacterium]|nr:redox-regulated ATPase YchF [Spirochaetota bacterium]HOM38788.1 redox-regulated ATPase YchF [Spirochaetota bacterium]HPQ49846.1 redox-regulated ATPase YchF [Spirochaetota bacterium]
MGFSCGIVGLPNVGKSTLFNSLTKANVESSNYPFCTIDPNIGVVPVPDKRLYKLAELVNPQKITPTFIKFIDIAGIVRGASKGEGLGNQFLANIRETDAMIIVLRFFNDPDVVHVDGRINPLDDFDTIMTELILKDIETLEKRFEKAKKLKLAGKDTKEKEIIEEIIAGLEKEDISVLKNEKFDEIRNELRLLTDKPIMIACNLDENQLTSYENLPEFIKLKEKAKKINAKVVVFSAKLEAELKDMPEEEVKELLASYNLKESGLDRIVKEGYEMLDLITFFTAGEKEVRAWTIKKGTKAPDAAGVIHTDFKKGFIKAEVISYNDFIEAGSYAKARELGKIRLEGKDYVFQDGDITIFRFNV